MFRPMPFNLRENAEKGQEFINKVLEAALEHPLNPLDKVSGVLYPFKVDVIDYSDRYEIFAELPGFRKEDISVTYDEAHYFKIKAERDNLELSDARYLCHERKAGKVERTFMIDEVDEAGVKVAYENGILFIIIPKLETVNNRKEFDIQ